MNNNSQPFVITDNDVKKELNGRKIKNSNKDVNTVMSVPRYGTTVDLKTNKVIDQIDKYQTRHRLFESTDLINEKKYRISRLNIDSRYRNIDPKNIINKYISVDTPFIFKENSNELKIIMPINHISHKPPKLKRYEHVVIISSFDYKKYGRKY